MTFKELFTKYDMFKHYAKRRSWSKYHFLSYLLIYEPMIINGKLEFVSREVCEEDENANDWEILDKSVVESYKEENTEFLNQLESIELPLILEKV